MKRLLGVVNRQRDPLFLPLAKLCYLVRNDAIEPCVFSTGVFGIESRYERVANRYCKYSDQLVWRWS